MNCQEGRALVKVAGEQLLKFELLEIAQEGIVLGADLRDGRSLIFRRLLSGKFLENVKISRARLQA